MWKRLVAAILLQDGTREHLERELLERELLIQPLAQR